MASSSKILLLLLHWHSTVVLLLWTVGTASGSGLAINYGRIGNNMPDPQVTVAPLIKSIHAARVRLYDADERVLKAFANTGVEVTVGLGNEYLEQVLEASRALAWVNSNVKCYLPATKITSIAVGNEALTMGNASGSLLPAMESIHGALVAAGLEKQVSVTTAHNLGVLEVSFPPSAGRFRADLAPTLRGILEFHCRTGSAFMINAYPFFAYKADPARVSLKFALFQGDGFLDPGSSLRYDSMFVAQIDAAHSAMQRLGPAYKSVCLQVAETGWPSAGDPDEPGATPDNARTYNTNLLKLVQSNRGTPMRPNLDWNVFLFALFNENRKLGPASERNFGLFYPNATPVYDLGFTYNAAPNAPPFSPVVVISPPADMSIDGANPAERLHSGGALLPLLCLAILATLAVQV